MTCDSCSSCHGDAGMLADRVAMRGDNASQSIVIPDSMGSSPPSFPLSGGGDPVPGSTAGFFDVRGEPGGPRWSEKAFSDLASEIAALLSSGSAPTRREKVPIERIADIAFGGLMQFNAPSQKDMHELQHIADTLRRTDQHERFSWVLWKIEDALSIDYSEETSGGTRGICDWIAKRAAPIDPFGEPELVFECKDYTCFKWSDVVKGKINYCERLACRCIPLRASDISWWVWLLIALAALAVGVALTAILLRILPYLLRYFPRGTPIPNPGIGVP